MSATATWTPVPLAPDYQPHRDVGTQGARLTHGPLLMRGRAGYRRHDPRWHRPRSGWQYPRHVAWQYWCGQSGHHDLMTADSIPHGEKVCGSCEGRAIGAGWPPSGLPAGYGSALTFTPPRLEPPNPCPGSRGLLAYDRHDSIRELPGGRTGECLFCGAVEPIRGGSRGYGWTEVGLPRHQPHQLIDPCPDHGWFSMRRWEGQLVCRCQLVEEPPPRPRPRLDGPAFDPGPDDDLEEWFQ